MAVPAIVTIDLRKQNQIGLVTQNYDVRISLSPALFVSVWTECGENISMQCRVVMRAAVSSLPIAYVVVFRPSSKLDTTVVLFLLARVIEAILTI